jgi:hypothetical protein
MVCLACPRITDQRAPTTPIAHYKRCAKIEKDSRALFLKRLLKELDLLLQPCYITLGGITSDSQFSFDVARPPRLTD